MYKKHTPKTCFVGNEKGYGCPWNEQPFAMSRNTNCGMCMECFKTFPYDNMAVNLRSPGVGLVEEPKQLTVSRGNLGLDEAFKGFTMFGIMIVFFLTNMGPYGIFKDYVRAIPIKGNLTYIQIFFLAIGLLFSLEYGYKIARRLYPKLKEAARAWVPILIFLVGLHIALLWLFVG